MTDNKVTPVDTNTFYSADNWYGALYYAIQPFRKERHTCYLILGLDYGKSVFSRKIADVLSFNDDGEIIFGLNVFEKNGNTKYREVLEYSPDGLLSLRINSKDLFVFDHITSFSSGHEGSSDSYGSGLFFDGYRYERGLWRFETNIDIRNPKKK
jgi:hypothetical protein